MELSSWTVIEHLPIPGQVEGEARKLVVEAAREFAGTYNGISFPASPGQIESWLNNLVKIATGIRSMIFHSAGNGLSAHVDGWLATDLACRVLEHTANDIKQILIRVSRDEVALNEMMLDEHREQYRSQLAESRDKSTNANQAIHAAAIMYLWAVQGAVFRPDKNSPTSVKN